MSVNMNQFKKTAFVGQIDLKSGGLDNSFTLRIDPDSLASDLVPGTALQVVDGGSNDPNGVPLCNVLTEDADPVFGAIIYTAKKGLFQPGDIVQVSHTGVIQYFEAAAALPRWSKVSLQHLIPGQVIATTAETRFGYTLDKAFGAGDIIRVLINIEPKP